MAFLILMIGVYLIISIKEKGVSLFKNKALDFIHLTFYVSTIGLYVVNSSFVQFVPNIPLVYVSILLVVPVFVTFLKRKDMLTHNKKQEGG